MSETSKERRRRERTERKRNPKNPAKEARFNGWYLLVAALILFAVAAVCGYRIFYTSSESVRFEGTFLRLERGPSQGRIKGFIYENDQNQVENGRLHFFQKIYRELERNDRIVGLVHGGTVVELEVNGVSRFTIEDYISWHWFGVSISILFGLVSAFLSWGYFKNAGSG